MGTPRLGSRPADRAPLGPRLPILDRIATTIALNPFLSLRALATYANLSLRTLRYHLADPSHPLPCYRVGGKILVRRSEFDVWVSHYRQVGRADVASLVTHVLQDMAALPTPRGTPRAR
jgi:hypothetical protein